MLERLERLREAALVLFQERHLHMRTQGQVTSLRLTPRTQMLAAGLVAGLLLWTVIASVSAVVGLVAGASAQASISQTRAHYEKLLAERDARLQAAARRFAGAAGSLESLARSVTQRHQALEKILNAVKPRAALEPRPGASPTVRAEAAMHAIASVEQDQDRILDAASAYARARAERLKSALRLAGVTAGAPRPAAMGGPFIPADNPKALASLLNVDEDFARRIAAASGDVAALKGLDDKAARVPLAAPVRNAGQSQTSDFGVRADPFTGRSAFHAGQDFAGAARTPVKATAAGLVLYTGPRTGYGNVVELGHEGGFMTRYAHLSAVLVRRGQSVVLGQTVGAMGSTGRSTGVHLHYEVWRNGRVQDPTTFIKAGRYVQEGAG